MTNFFESEEDDEEKKDENKDDEKKFMFNLKDQLLKRFISNLIKYLGKGKSENSITFLFFSVVNWNIKKGP